jgi:ribosomal protein L29
MLGSKLDELEEEIADLKQNLANLRGQLRAPRLTATAEAEEPKEVTE